MSIGLIILFWCMAWTGVTLLVLVVFAGVTRLRTPSPKGKNQ